MMMIKSGFCLAVVTAMIFIIITASSSDAVRYKGAYLCNWLHKLEQFFLCHNNKVGALGR